MKEGGINIHLAVWLGLVKNWELIIVMSGGWVAGLKGGEGRVCSSLQIFNKLLLARLPHCNRSSGCKRQQSNIISFSFIIWWRLQVLQGASYNSYLVGICLCKSNNKTDYNLKINVTFTTVISEEINGRTFLL